MKKPREGREGLRSAAMVSTAGLTLALCVVIGVLAGYGVDRWLKTTGFVILGFFLGLAAGFIEFLRAVNQANRGREFQYTARIHF